jgi:hypothetical protein
VHVDTAFYTNVVEPYLVEHFDDQMRDAIDSYENHLVRDAGGDSKEEAKPPDEAWASVFEAEYGLRPTDFGWILGALGQDAYNSKAAVVIKTVAELEALIVEETECAVQAAKKFLGRLILPAREKWDATPSGFKDFDWYPWRSQRKLSVVSRPIVEVDPERVVYAPGMMEDTLRYLVENSLLGVLPPDYFLSPEMAAWAGARAASDGKEFESRVFQRVKELGLNARTQVLMSDLGVPADQADLRQSDVDVLAWDAATGTIFVIECKRLKLARTIGEIADQLNDFRNETDPQGKNKLARHQERAEWLVANQAGL